MVEIPSHSPAPTPQAENLLADVLSVRDRMPDVIQRKPRLAGFNFSSYFDGALRAMQLGRSDDVARSCLDLALELGVAGFRLANELGTVNVTIAGRELSLPATGPTDATHPMTWLDLFGLTLALRRSAATNAICAVDVDVLRASTARVDDYRYEIVHTMEAFWTGGDWRAAAARAIDRSQPQFTKVVGQDYVELDLAIVRMLEPLDARDAAMFNAALAAALEAHKRHWSSKRWAGDLRGLVAMAPLGLAALALDRGVPIDVKSGYMPEWLLRNDAGVA